MPLHISGGEDEAEEVERIRSLKNVDVRGDTAVGVSASPNSPKNVVSEVGRIATAKATPSTIAVDKQSREYVLKSGLAGGLAGCAV